jgi:hypothetical protein
MAERHLQYVNRFTGFGHDTIRTLRFRPAGGDHGGLHDDPGIGMRRQSNG